MKTTLGLYVVLVLLVSSSLAVPLQGLGSPAIGAPSHGATQAATSTPAARAPAPLVASGRGTFLNTTSLPFGGNRNLCAYPPTNTSTLANTCGPSNVSNDPSAVVIPTTGAIAVAYTAYTNYSACGYNWTLTEVGFTLSTNDGANWSSPSFIGNNQCNGQNATWYANSWEPALTVLPNGTLVLAFEEWSEQPGQYGCYSYGYCYNEFPDLYPNYNDYGTPYGGGYNASRIVVTRSYDSGTSWTNPLVLNQSTFDPTTVVYGPTTVHGSASWTDENAVIASSGDTVYLAWQNTSWELYPDYAAGTPYPALGDMGVQLVVSTNGGASWGTQQAMPIIPAQYSLIAANPSILTTPSGQVVIAYITNTTEECLPYFSGTYSYCDTYSAATPVIGNSSDNGTTWTWSYLPTAFALQYNEFDDENPFFISLQPTIAYDPVTANVIVTYQTFYNVTECGNGYCYPELYSRIAIANSSLTAWSFHPHLIAQFAEGENQSLEGLYSAYLTPAITVTANGTLYFSTSFYNESLTAPYLYGVSYGATQQLFSWSTNDGATFANPIIVNSVLSFGYTEAPEGVHAQTFLPDVGGSPALLWTYAFCANATTSSYCYYELTDPVNPTATLEFSDLFNGTGTTLTFNEAGLPNGTVWSVNVQGNIRGGAAPTSLSVSGVPIGLSAGFVISNISTYNTRLSPVTNLTAPLLLTGPTSVQVNYTLEYLVDIRSIPNLPIATYPYNAFPYYCDYYAFGNGCTSVNYNITGSFGALWVPAGTLLNTTFIPLNNSQLPNPYWKTCTGCYFDYLNLSFLSWSGTGPGSINSTALNVSLNVSGPINETANFNLNSFCEWSTGLANYSVCLPSSSVFSFTETGLPSGSSWGVDLFGLSAGETSPYVATSTTSSLTVDNPVLGQTAEYLPLTVPGGTNQIYVANGTPGSPIEIPMNGSVVLHYHLVTKSTGVLPSLVEQVGLPTGLNWSYSVNGGGLGVSGSDLLVSIALGTDLLNASPIYLNNGTGYYLEGIDYLPLTPGAVWDNTTAGAQSIAIESSAVVVFVYAQQYQLVVASSVGGTATAATGWYPGNTTIDLTATASAGYSFAGWTGGGIGGVTGTGATIEVSMISAVRELASFAVNPATRFVVTVDATGLPAGLTALVEFNGSWFSGAGEFALPGVVSGNYTFQAVDILGNGTIGIQAVPGTITSTFNTTMGGAFEVVKNGTITVPYAIQYSLTVTAGANGTASMLGSTWEASGASVPLNATPAAGYQVLAWVGSGNGSVSGNSTGITPVLMGPVSETVTFVAIPATAKPTFALTVTESGLPSGTPWSISVGGLGVGSTTGSISVAALSGTVTIAFAPAAGSTSGVQYTPNATSKTVTFTNAAVALTVTFATEFWLQVTTTSGGTSAQAGGAWYASGATVDLSAVASANYVFANWTGMGAGAYTGNEASTSVTVNGPITEVAAFVLAHSATTNTTNSGSSTAGLPLDLALLAVLLVVGLVVALLIGRPRRGYPPASSDEAIAAGWEETAPAPAPWEEPPTGGSPSAETPSDGSTVEGPSGPGSN
jgi:Divergent InlB B-repeat domain